MWLVQNRTRADHGHRGQTKGQLQSTHRSQNASAFVSAMGHVSSSVLLSDHHTHQFFPFVLPQLGGTGSIVCHYNLESRAFSLSVRGRSGFRMVIPHVLFGAFVPTCIPPTPIGPAPISAEVASSRRCSQQAEEVAETNHKQELPLYRSTPTLLELLLHKRVTTPLDSDQLIAIAFHVFAVVHLLPSYFVQESLRGLHIVTEVRDVLHSWLSFGCHITPRDRKHVHGVISPVAASPQRASSHPLQPHSVGRTSSVHSGRSSAVRA